MHKLHYRRFWIMCGVSFALGVAILSLVPDPPHTHRVMGVKLGHFLAYAWLMFWFAQIFKDTAARLLIAVSICALGVALEYLQAFTGYRTFSYLDMRDNAFGVIAGFLACLTPLCSTLAAAEDGFRRLMDERFRRIR
jgi:VanZ family protein